MEKIRIELQEEDIGRRVDSFLAEKSDFSRSKIHKLMSLEKIVKINQEEKAIFNNASYKVKDGDSFIIEDIKQEIEDIIPKKMDIDILYEDEYLLIVNKSYNMVVHPAAGNYDNTLVNGLVYRYKEGLSSINGEFRPGIVHRLDKDTSGVLVIAKDDDTHYKLAKQFEEHSVVRAYRALIWGKPFKSKGKIETFITRSPYNRQKMMVSKTKGKKAITNYQVLQSKDNLVSSIKLNLETGRTHQIRVHMCYLGHCILGDKVYSNAYTKYLYKLDSTLQKLIMNLSHQALHAYKIGFIHPKHKEYLEVKKEEPQDLLDIYNLLWQK